MDNITELLNQLSNKSTQKKIETYIQLMLRTTKIQVTMNKGIGSFAGKKGKYICVNIDPTIAVDEKDDYVSALIKCKGMAAHEAGHLMHSDYEVIKQNSICRDNCKKEIAEIGTVLKENMKDKGLLDKLKSAIYTYIYAEKRISMLNSLEDGAVESRTPIYFPATYGPISHMRNFIYKEEKKYLEKITYNISKKDKDLSLEILITSIRQFAVMGQREKIKPYLLNEFLSKKDIQKIKEISYYARVASKDTSERNILAEVLLDMLSEKIQKKTEAFMEKYLEALTTSPEEAMESLASMMAAGMPPTEAVFNIPLNGNLSGMNILQQPQSEYEFNLPSDIQEEINKKKEDNKQNSNSDKKESSNQTSQDTSQESTDTADSNKDASDGSNSLLDNKEDIFTPSSSAKNKQESLKAENAIKESFLKEKRTVKGESKKEFTEYIDKDGKAPKFYSEEDGLNDYHKGIPVYWNHPEVMKTRDKFKDSTIEEIHPIAMKFSEKLRTVLMYQAKNRSVRGVSSGKINNTGLDRVITDKKIFKKDAKGTETKARVQVLMDLSGSMQGIKLQNTIKATYLLIDACSRIGVPIDVIGHNNKNGVSLYHFLDYKDFKKKELWNRIFSASAGFANHDGLAILEAGKHLHKYGNAKEKKVLIVISDGAPAGCNGYHGEPAYRDIQQINNALKQYYQIETIGIGIGEDSECVAEIYKEYILVPDVESLPQELLEVLKKIMLKN